MVVRGGGGGKGAEVVVVLVRGGGVGGCVTALRPKLLYAHRALAPMRVSMAYEGNAEAKCEANRIKSQPFSPGPLLFQVLFSLLLWC